VHAKLFYLTLFLFAQVYDVRKVYKIIRSACFEQKLVFFSHPRGDDSQPDLKHQISFLGSIVVSISACHVEDPGSIPGRGGFFFAPFHIINE
jgi:hypothetical protein